MDLFVVDIEFENLNVEQLNYLTRCVIGRWLLLASKGAFSFSQCNVSASESNISLINIAECSLTSLL